MQATRPEGGAGTGSAAAGVDLQASTDAEVSRHLPEPVVVDLAAMAGHPWTGASEERPPRRLVLASRAGEVAVWLHDGHRDFWVFADALGRTVRHVTAAAAAPAELRACGAALPGRATSPGGQAQPSGGQAATVVALERSIGEPLRLVALTAEVGASGGVVATRKVVPLPEPWRLRDAGADPCALVALDDVLWVVVALEAPAGKAAVLTLSVTDVALLAAELLPAEDDLFVAPSWTLAADPAGGVVTVGGLLTSREGGSTPARFGVWEAALGRAPERVPSGWSGAGRSGSAGAGLLAWHRGALGVFGLGSGDGGTQDEVAPLLFAGLRGSAPDHEQALGALPARAWGDRLSAVTLGRESLVLLLPVMPASASRRLAVLLVPGDASPPLYARSGVADAAAAEWGSEGSAVVVATLLSQDVAEEAPAQATLELTWLGVNGQGTGVPPP